MDTDIDVALPPSGLGGAATTQGGSATTVTLPPGIVGVGGSPRHSGGGGSTSSSGYTSLGGGQLGGIMNTGGVVNTGGTVNTGGRATAGAGLGGRATSGAAGRWTGGTGGIGGSGGSAGRAGMAGSGIGGAAGALSCNPSRAGARSMIGAAGAVTSPLPLPLAGATNMAGASSFAGAAGIGGEAASDWFVDAINGSDHGAGTKASPLKTLSCASSVARAGETVRLLDGTWDASVDPKLGNSMTSACGVDSGIAFAPNVSIRAVNIGAAAIKSTGYHAVCMTGGAIEGVRLTCPQGRPAVATSAGSLQITSSDFIDCTLFGLEIAGDANVTLRPGRVANYLDGIQVGLAYVHGASSLTVDGGTVSYQARAFLVEDTASLTLQGVTVRSSTAVTTAGPAVNLANGTPHLTVNGGTVFDGTTIAVYGYSSTSSLAIDGMSVVRGGNAFIISEEPNGFVPKIAINRLAVTDSTGLGVDVTGTFDLSVTNSTFTRVGAPAVMPSGSGSVILDGLTFTDGWGAILIGGSSDSLGLKVKVRNVTATGNSCCGANIMAGTLDTFDFGTAASPGNNVFRGNNVSGADGCANFVFALPSSTVVTAIGNTWDANRQGADADGHYWVTGVGFDSLLVSEGLGPNFLAGSGNLGKLLLATSP